MPSDTVLLMIGIFIILGVFTILGIIIYFKRKNKKILEGLPSEDFKKLNYDPDLIKKREEMKALSNNEKEVNNHATNKETISSEEEDRNRSNYSIQEEDRGAGSREVRETRGANVNGRSFVEKGITNGSEQNSKRARKFRPSWR